MEWLNYILMGTVLGFIIWVILAAKKESKKMKGG